MLRPTAHVSIFFPLGVDPRLRFLLCFCLSSIAFLPPHPDTDDDSLSLLCPSTACPLLSRPTIFPHPGSVCTQTRAPPGGSRSSYEPCGKAQQRWPLPWLAALVGSAIQASCLLPTQDWQFCEGCSMGHRKDRPASCP